MIKKVFLAVIFSIFFISLLTNESSVKSYADGPNFGDIKIERPDKEIEQGKVNSTVIVTNKNNDGTKQAWIWNIVYDNLNFLANFIIGISFSILAFLFIKNGIILQANANNPEGRRSAIKGIIWCSLALMLLGIVLILYLSGLGLFK